MRPSFYKSGAGQPIRFGNPNAKFKYISAKFCIKTRRLTPAFELNV